MTQRGFSYAQAVAYVGVKRRTFDEKWRPHLVAIPQGSSLIFDRDDLDRLFERFKADAAGIKAANDTPGAAAHNGGRNGRPANTKGEKTWAKQPGESTPSKTGPGKLTSGGEVLDFDAAALLVTKRQKAG